MATDDDLISAYLDGVGELTPDERKRVEQRLATEPALRAEADALRSLLARARALPAEGGEPDWLRMERQIREAVGPRVPVPWWRRARWLAPVGTLVTTAAIALLWLHHTGRVETMSAPTRDAGAVLQIAPTPAPPPVPIAAAQPTPPPAPTTMYIDGQVIDIGNVDPEALIDDDDGDGDTAAAAQTDGLLPAGNDGWIDQLDDKSLERAERWLAGKKG